MDLPPFSHDRKACDIPVTDMINFLQSLSGICPLSGGIRISLKEAGGKMNFEMMDVDAIILRII